MYYSIIVQTTPFHEWKSDLYYLEEFNGDLTGIGKVPIKGIGNLHWQIKPGEGRIIDIIVKDALYCPNMQYRILSITQWESNACLHVRTTSLT